MLSSNPSPLSLPTPGPEALQLSEQLAELIGDEIVRAGGCIDFGRYMELALYAPGLGYYSAGSTKLGSSGDFVTAPELSAALAKAFATTLAAELEAVGAAEVLELGAGSGALAEQLIDALRILGYDVHYRILEPSADLRARQQQRLERFVPRVTWLDALPQVPFAGAIVANEVLDALPVSRFVKSSGVVRALGVATGSEGFQWRESAAPAALADAVAQLERSLGAPLPDGYRSEVCLVLPAWLATLARALERGCLLLADYGLVRSEYYHEQRDDGTLMCHYRHRAHANPFVYPGLQDITAWVDFSACSDAARAVGLTVAGFTTQAQYLLGALTMAPASLALDLTSPREQSALKTLILPGEMGERFKVLLLRQGYTGPELPGRDFRPRL